MSAIACLSRRGGSVKRVIAVDSQFVRRRTFLFSDGFKPNARREGINWEFYTVRFSVFGANDYNNNARTVMTGRTYNNNNTYSGKTKEA